MLGSCGLVLLYMTIDTCLLWVGEWVYVCMSLDVVWVIMGCERGDAMPYTDTNRQTSSPHDSLMQTGTHKTSLNVSDDS